MNDTESTTIMCVEQSDFIVSIDYRGVCMLNIVRIDKYSWIMWLCIFDSQWYRNQRLNEKNKIVERKF